MQIRFSLLALAIFALLFLLGCTETSAPGENSINHSLNPEQQLSKRSTGNSGNIVVANRNSGSISVIDVKTDQLSGTYSLPAAPSPPEPMYVVFVRQAQRVFVGDRANDQVVVFRASDFSIEGSVPAGAGIFHMWADRAGKQLWVNNDIDNTTTIIDPQSLQVIATTPTPADLVSMGGKPHDVILGPQGKFAYVTVLGISGPSDYVVQYSTQTFQETGRAAVGQDPHLSLTPGNRSIYVPCQNSDAIFVLNRLTMEQVTIINIAGAHGAGMPVHGNEFYTTNLPGGGSDGLFVIDTRQNEIIGSSDTPFPIPHNIAFPTSAKKLYLTHSGASSDKVSIYRVSNRHPVPVFLKNITVGLNPFGLAFAK
ncbi:MAG: beta-propeller fold lactonase family protein [Calditrichae bacterium]|nr:beta-propeller fold lactonase family protein [Calditrichia bacterium]NIW80661.1 beta-propeller fold lactonase family protein [Calditrichia bacterium]